ncbi:protein-L-isoaspartate O-methyltransferase [Maritimibacter sp. HL-12]|uniref:protein-L-isoaspartate O-methyltransferase family protein n=1 Tax=Maritimibacter sp. HL-12 TaxID=1162418 RepID=UPI000A0F3494|nr:protein-L-isoaspartate O-methyltransferase [Maritimibacter sp. HL-12]SMH53585.1 protein-L-isoaspartate(D-aspartate) O-methyltransferase [Maritimibacter sp. HL-12]
MSDFQALRTMMVDTQVRPSDVTRYPVIGAMLAVPREAFVPDGLRAAAYADTAVDLGAGRAMLEPRTFAKMLDALEIGSGELVLDLGCGLGYSAAVIARMVDFVVALEQDEAMAAEAETRLGAQGVDNVAVISGRLRDGDAKHGPYDAIVVEGGVERLPAGLVDQLKDGGRIAAIFADNRAGALRIGQKWGDHVDWRFAFNATAPVLPGFEKVTEFAL